ncbi:MAG: hypothetical protein RIK87_00625 [Fuerstiella sp.]
MSRFRFTTRPTICFPQPFDRVKLIIGQHNFINHHLSGLVQRINPQRGEGAVRVKVDGQRLQGVGLAAEFAAS